ncbi:MAG: BamA/TamA family outer membrane protein [Bacteroidales bacterium]|nr:BamA/TamA family outer membrane protein [Bacteroidales bacterium]
MRHLAAPCLLSLLLCLSAAAKDKAAPLDRKGFFGLPFPIISYNSDLGFNTGVCGDLLDYGQGGLYPDYRQKLHFELSWFTKGKLILHADYDSKDLLENVRFFAAATWDRDPMCNFYGLNGSLSPYDRTLDRKGGIAMYSYNRQMIRVLGNASGRIVGPLKWTAGLNWRYYITRDIDMKGYDPAMTMYRKCVENGIISTREASGGQHLDLRAGIEFDTRDYEPCPNKGCWGELMFIGSPDITGGPWSYLQLAMRWRQYIAILREGRLTFAYQLGWQQKLWGELPFYLLQEMGTLRFKQPITEGLGGMTTLRGVLGNRLLGDGYAWTNIELRSRVYSFRVFKRFDIDIGVNPFCDLGWITAPVRIGAFSALTGLSEKEVWRETCRTHGDAGIGLKLTMNGSYIVSLEWAMPFRRDDGDYGLFVAMNYIF